MTPRARVLTVVVFGLALACASEPTTNPLVNDPPTPLEPDSRALVDASVEFLNLEGGCWVLAAGDISYLPMNLPDQYRRDGLAVQVEFVRRDAYASICMVGPVVEILSIRAR